LPGVDHGRQINQQWMFTAAQVDVLRMRQLQYDKNPRVVTSRRVTVNWNVANNDVCSTTSVRPVCWQSRCQCDPIDCSRRPPTQPMCLEISGRVTGDTHTISICHRTIIIIILSIIILSPYGKCGDIKFAVSLFGTHLIRKSWTDLAEISHSDGGLTRSLALAC